MRILASTHCALLLSVATTTLAGCGGLPTASPAVTQAGTDRSWMLPEARTTGLLYDAGSRDNKHVFVFTYPGGKFVGRLGGLWDPGTAMCVDASQNIWISSASPPEMVEYAHGNPTPIAMLPNSYGLAVGCSIDVTTGDLAVANIFGTGSKPYTSIIVFQNAQGNPTVYTVDNFEYIWGCAYDPSGNLFAVGNVFNKGTHMAELPAGGSQFQDLKVSRSVGEGWLQWHGSYLYVGADPGGVYPEVDQLLVNGSRVTLKKKITLDQADKTTPFFIDGDTAIAHVDPKTGTVGFWRFPAGGNPTKILPNGFHEKSSIQNGVAVSLAPK